MVIREDFDNYFFNYVKQKGADFLNSKVVDIYEDKDEIIIKTDHSIIKSKYLIGADGANSTIRRLITDLKFENPVFAFEGLVDKKTVMKTYPQNLYLISLVTAGFFRKKITIMLASVILFLINLILNQKKVISILLLKNNLGQKK